MGETLSNHYENRTIGYLVPEFPGQTHVLFWRECRALKQLGVSTALISTRRPPPEIVCHSWASVAIERTTYLHPLGLRGGLQAFAELMRAGPKRIVSVLKIAFSADSSSIGSKFKLFTLILYAARVISLARRGGWSHVHVGSCGTSADIAWIASKLGDITYSLSMLGPDFSTYGPNQMLKWGHASFGLFQSAALLNEGRQLLGTTLPTKVAIAPVGVDVDFMKRDLPFSPWNRGERCVIYSCGRLNRVKGHRDVIEALKLVRLSGIDAYLQIAGEDEEGGVGYRRNLQSLINDEQLADFVTLVGAVSEEAGRKFLSGAHIYVMGSLNEAAGAVAAMEAMAMQVPVVMTNVGATTELITNGIDGVLVEKERPDQLAAAIIRVLMDSKLAIELGRAGREKIVSEFNHQVSAKLIASFLSEIGK